MTEKKTYGRTPSGRVITEELIQEAVAEAERGYDVDEILRRRVGRPPMGNGPAAVESVRLDPQLDQALRERAKQEHRTNSEIIREALRQYLKAS